MIGERGIVSVDVEFYGHPVDPAISAAHNRGLLASVNSPSARVVWPIMF